MAFSKDAEFLTFCPMGAGRILLSLILSLSLLPLLTVSSIADNVTIEWTLAGDDEDVLGYNVYVLGETGRLPVQDVHRTNRFAIEGLSPNSRYLIFVTAYDSYHVESPASTVLQYPQSSPCFIGAMYDGAFLPNTRSPGKFYIVAAPNCTNWTTTTDASWVQLGTPVPDGGRTLVPYVVHSNRDEDVRSALITVANQLITVLQASGKPSPPVVVSELSLADRVVNEGGSIDFGLTVEDDRDLQYQWLKDNSPIPGATSSFYSISGALPVDAGSYTIQITNNVGVTQEGPLQVFVIEKPRITKHPRGITAPDLGNYYAPFSVAATGTGLDYTWLKDGVPFTNGLAQIVVGPLTNEVFLGAYQVVVFNPAGSVLSEPALLTTTELEGVLGRIRVTLLSDSSLRVRGHGIAGQTYDIQISRDLSEWSTYASVTVSENGIFNIDAPLPAEDPSGSWFVRTLRQP
jgi:hypothetical protein